MPYTPTPLDLITPADSNHSCFSKVNQNFEDINTAFTEISGLVAGGFDYFKTVLTGGTAGCLDQMDGDGLSDGDKAIVIVGNNPGRTYIYVLDEDNAGAEDSPYIIAPDTNPGNKRWVLSARIPRTWKGAGTPTSTDDYNDGVRNGDWWLYGGNAYMCVSETAGNAVWRIIPQLGTGATNAAAGDHNHSTVNIASTAISDWAEAVQDTAGAMWSGNAETGLSIAYDDASGKINASVSYGTEANTACQGNDSRLSDSRTPTSHSLTSSHTVSGLTTGHILQATAATTFGFGDLGTVINGATAKTSVHNDDMLPLMDSEATNVVKKLSWTYVKSVLKTYFDGLYSLTGHTHSYAASDHNHDGSYSAIAHTHNYATLIAASFTQATSSPVTLLDPPNNAVVTEIVVVVDSAASGGSPTVSVGTASDPDRDMDEPDSDIKTAATYIVEPYTACGTNGDNIILTITPDSQTFSGRCYLHYVVPV